MNTFRCKFCSAVWRKMKSKAFTLLELLLVITILGIVIAMIAPTLARCVRHAMRIADAVQYEKMNQLDTFANAERESEEALLYWTTNGVTPVTYETLATTQAR